MSNKASDNKELLAWAAAKIAEAQAAGMFGTVTIFIEGGKIIRSETKQLDKPGTERPACLTS